MSSDRCRVGLFGAGTRGTILADHLVTHPEVRIEAVVDVDTARAQTLANRLGGSVYSDYQKALSNGVFDLVVVATMPITHRDMCIAALESGANVLCEKPFAMNAAEVTQMIEASRRASRFLTVGCNMRYMGSAQYLKTLMATNSIGALIYTHAWSLQSGIPFFGPHYVKRLAGGGVGAADAVHVLDLAIWVSGHGWPTTVSASKTRIFPHKRANSSPSDQATRDYDVEDLMSGHIRFDDGTWMTLELAWAWDRFNTSLSFLTVGDRATVEFDPLSVIGEKGDKLSDMSPSGVADSDWDRSTAREIDDVVTAVCEGTEPLVKAEEVLKVQVIVDALYRSAESHNEVTIS